jgi:hypothetical protein
MNAIINRTVFTTGSASAKNQSNILASVDFKNKIIPSKIAIPIQKIDSGEIIVDGVVTSRFPTQASLAKTYSAKDLDRLGINKRNTHIYVIDNFIEQPMPVGYGPKARKVSHGEVVTNIIENILHGKAEVNRVDIDAAEKASSVKDFDVKPKLIMDIIQIEAKKQGKTKETVDLSHVSINLSQGNSCSKNCNYPDFQKAVDSFTQKGGRIFIAAGNEYYSGYAAFLKNISVVDGSSEYIGGTISQNPSPWAAYNNQALTDGKDTRLNRQMDKSSQSIIAPSVIKTRIDKSGNVELQNSSSPTGYSKFIVASRSIAAPSVEMFTAGIEGTTPKRGVMAKDVEGFLKWRKDFVDSKSDIFRDEDYKKISDEYIRVFGQNPVITLDEYEKYAVKNPEIIKPNHAFRFHQIILASLPNKLRMKEIFVPVYQVLPSNEFDSNIANLQYFFKEKDGRLKSIPHAVENVTNGTSWATPFATAMAAIETRRQVVEGQR